MNIKFILKILGMFTLVLGIFMLLPLAWSIYYRDGDSIALFHSFLITCGLGLFFYITCRKARGDIFRKEGMFIVTVIWILAALLGALPFFLSDTWEFSSYLDCVFETMSGFTTTGASILTEIEMVPRGLLFWRSLTHWLGGMGIIVLFIAVLPFLGVGERVLFASEVPGPSPEGLKPRIVQTARTLWIIYLTFTFAEILLLYLAGMNLFDSMCHTFGTMATGGFSTRNTSIGSYNLPVAEGIITLFMVFAGINFSLYYHALKGNVLTVFRDIELRVYLIMITCLIVLSSLILYIHGSYDSFVSSFRYASFQVVSILTTTGYSTADFDLWPSGIKVLLLVLMFIGGCAGSTGGGMKVIRIIVLFKDGLREIRRNINPRSVLVLKLKDQIVKDQTVSSIRGFFILFIMIFFLASIIMAGFGLDPITALSSVAATMGNIGPGLGHVGPSLNYSHVPDGGKVVLIFCMLIGRLELFTVLVLLVPYFWKR